MTDMRSARKCTKPKRVHEEIVARIEKMIRSGELKTGDRLPPERQLAEHFKVSRHAVREAIRALEQKSLVESHVGAGTFVLEGRQEQVLNALADAIVRGKDKLREVFEFRRLIEPQIAALASRKATAKDIAELRDLLKLQAKAVVEETSASDIDTAFHQKIVQMTGNSVIVDFWGQMDDVLDETRSDSLQSKERQQQSMLTHARIVAALEQGDAESVCLEMLQHLEEIERAVFERE